MQCIYFFDTFENYAQFLHVWPYERIRKDELILPHYLLEHVAQDSCY